MSSHTRLRSIWMLSKIISSVRSPTLKETLINRKGLNLCWICDRKYRSVTRLFSNCGEKAPDCRTISRENSGNRGKMEEESGIITTDVIGGEMNHEHDNISKESHTGTPVNISNDAFYENDPQLIDKKVKRKKKKAVSAMMKVIIDKKMLERYRQTSRRRKDSSSVIPLINSGSGFKDQLLDYISRHDETWENVDSGKQFAVSKRGNVMMFPLTNLDLQSEKVVESSSKNTKLPSVTTILHVTRPMKQALSLLKWENRMISELGEDGFKQMKQEMFAQGHSIHKTFEKYLKGTFTADLDLSIETIGFWESSSELLPRIKEPSGFEIKVKHPALSYTGYIDCIAEVDGKLTLIEWKTSRKPKLDLKNSEDYALQAVAYLGALNFDPEHTLQVEQIVIVVVYKDGMEATVHTLDEEACNHYWIKWLERLLEYQEIVDMKKAYVKRKIIAWSKTKDAEKEDKSL